MSNDPTPGVMALLVVGLLILVMRLIWNKKQRRGPIVDAAESRNLGLLSVVASKLPRDDAMAARARLGEVGIRSSMSKRKDGLLDVLVFHGDVDTARQLLDA